MRACSVLILLLVHVIVQAADAYTFALDSDACEPTRFDIGDGPHPGPGDLIEVDDRRLPLDGPGRYAFTADHERGTLRCSINGTPEVLVGVTISDGEELPPGDDLSHLRSVRLRGKPWPASGPRAEALDWSRIYLELRLDYTTDDAPVPESVADAVRYLEIGWRVSGSAHHRDLARLATGSGLRFLKLSGGGAAPIRGTWIARHVGLRHLDLSGGTLNEAPALGGLTQLREFRLGSTDNPVDPAFAATLTRLVEVDLSGANVSSLAPFIGLPDLAVIRANATLVADLPIRSCPGLRRLDVVGSAIPDAVMQAFRTANPAVRVLHHWVDGFQEISSRCDRMTLRTGGTCHRDPASEKTLFTTGDREAICLLIASLTLDEPASGGGCMCCGSCSLEFRAGDALIATLGVHHGIGLRWSGPDAPWPGDAHLTSAASDTLCAWLAEHGEDGPLREWTTTRHQEQSATRMLGYYRDILGEERLIRIRQATGKPDVVAILNESKPRAVTLLRLYGCGVREWNASWGLDRLIEEELEKAAPEVAAAADALIATPEGTDGLARWAFWLAGISDLPERVRVPVAIRALADPRAGNRRLAILGLDRCRDAWATAALRTALAGQQIRPLNPVEEVDPSGQVSFKGREWSPPQNASSRALAGLALARRGDAESLPAIRSLREGSTGDDRKALDEAVALYPAK